MTTQFGFYAAEEREKAAIIAIAAYEFPVVFRYVPRIKNRKDEPLPYTSSGG